MRSCTESALSHSATFPAAGHGWSRGLRYLGANFSIGLGGQAPRLPNSNRQVALPGGEFESCVACFSNSRTSRSCSQRRDSAINCRFGRVQDPKSGVQVLRKVGVQDLRSNTRTSIRCAQRRDSGINCRLGRVQDPKLGVQDLRRVGVQDLRKVGVQVLPPRERWVSKFLNHFAGFIGNCIYPCVDKK
jgi:hypothetical protein